MMTEFTIPDRRAFLQFFSGATRMPAGGLKIAVVRKEGGDEWLPSVMTCVGYLKCPDYGSLEVMRERFGVAMRECGSFHLS
jgi:E3 ubiquitin-protein ligase TRIP12